jgi:MFS family permease
MSEIAADQRAEVFPADPRERLNRGAVPVLAWAGITVAAMSTLLIPVVSNLPTLLHTSPSNATWVVTITLLVSAISTPILGRLGDLYGKRQMLLISLGSMIVGSLICGFTSNLTMMLIGRAFQGFSGGMVVLGIGIIRDMLPPAKLGAAITVVTTSVGLGTAFSRPGAALIAQNSDWHSLFFAAAVMCGLALLLVAFVVPETPVRAVGRFDWYGAIGLSAGLASLLLPITKGGAWGWGSPSILGMFALAIAILVPWGFMELKFSAPLFDLRITARRDVLLTYLVALLIGISLFPLSFVFPQLLQLPKATGYGLGQSMVTAGLLVAPLGLAMICTAPLFAWIKKRRGPKTTLILGTTIMVIGYTAGFGLMNAPWQTVIATVVVGIGIGLGYSSLPALIIDAVDSSRTGSAVGGNHLMVSIGTSTSSALVGMVLAKTTFQMAGRELPSMDGFRIAFLIAIGALLGALTIASFLPGRRTAKGSGGGPGKV